MSRASAEHDLHYLAAFVHGALAALHTLGALYNSKRRNRINVIFHTCAAAFSIRNMVHHIHESKE